MAPNRARRKHIPPPISRRKGLGCGSIRREEERLPLPDPDLDRDDALLVPPLLEPEDEVLFCVEAIQETSCL